ncbi:fumarylacetoacetate (FAA) hydrolase [Chloroherpeton thalassium ATCC 35110]|uniref:Fumarylacetoacetate (FAA) hydrolase n=1 Tax=Chloroherpeton thalassium (strain ATCC 35110 / GB-78) TaxID=517418 RepID=B3QZ66_CHLT3|nr:fumarylacetoacetate hydrolase family protein [Chloroherpeton thalassium]ACF13759.1 fumarylacetoacetate (FAA) hydrolase [Chloroherpeton thalassium ATCC 35110]
MATVKILEESVQVGTIYAIGKNYEAHAKEMQEYETKKLREVPSPSEPIVFSKPASSLITSGEPISISQVNGQPLGHDLHHEVELVVLIGRDCVNVTAENALNFVAGYAVGLDMTLRDRQTKAREQGHPWFISKGFRSSGAVSGFVPAAGLQPNHLFLELKRNGLAVQRGSTSKMIHSCESLISYLSQVFKLEAGDLIFTGTPEGVGAVFPGDLLEAKLLEESTGKLLAQLSVSVQ